MYILHITLQNLKKTPLIFQNFILDITPRKIIWVRRWVYDLPCHLHTGNQLQGRFDIIQISHGHGKMY